MSILLFALTIFSAPVERGPITVTVERVHDGDTVVVTIPGWPPVCGEEVGLRIAGIACPELNDPNPKDQELAFEARDYVLKRISESKKVQAADVRRDKYGGRYNCRVLLDGEDLGPELIRNGYAKPWNGQGLQPYKEND